MHFTAGGRQQRFQQELRGSALKHGVRFEKLFPSMPQAPGHAWGCVWKRACSMAGACLLQAQQPDVVHPQQRAQEGVARPAIQGRQECP